MEKVAQLLINLREDAKLSQEEVALRTNYSRQSISNWERGVCQPKVGDFLRLIHVYGRHIKIF